MIQKGGSGKIVIISSILSEIPLPTSSAYNMAKAAVNHLGRTLAAELTPYRINVNVVNPGFIDTPGERQFAGEEQIERLGRAVPWGRAGTPRDIGRAVAYLASDDADYVTGSALAVDGGYRLGMCLPVE
jgi:glucose 1-dehydrogenase